MGIHGGVFTGHVWVIFWILKLLIEMKKPEVPCIHRKISDLTCGQYIPYPRPHMKNRSHAHIKVEVCGGRADESY